MQTLNKIIHSPRQCAFYLLLTAGLIRILNILFLVESPLFAAPTSDELEHFDLASRVAAGDWLGRDEGLMMRTPLFAWVCAVVFRVLGTDFLVTHGIVLLSDLASVVLWYLVAVKCFSRVAAAVGGLMVCVYWPFIHFSSTGYMESFALALNGAMVLCLAVYFHSVGQGAGKLGRKAVGMLLLCGLFSGLSVLTRPTVLLVMPWLGLMVALPFFLAGRSGWWRGLVAGGLLTIATVVAMSPNAIRHWVLFDKWVPLGVNGELNFHMANNDEGWGWWISPGIEYYIYRDSPTAIGGRQIAIDDAREYWAEENQKFTREKTGVFVRGLAFKYLQAWNAYEVHVINDFREHKRLSPVERFALSSDVVIPLGFVGLVFCCWNGVAVFRRRKRSGGANPDGGLGPESMIRAVLCGWVVLYLAGVAIYHVNTRHRLPAFPPLVLLAGFALTEAGRAWKMRRIDVKPLVTVGALLVVGVVLSRLPVIPKWMPMHEDWWTHINKGTALVQLDREDEAVEEFRMATEVLPRKLEGWRQLALALDRLGRYKEAAKTQGKLLALLEEQYSQYTAMRAEQLEVLVRLTASAGDVARARELNEGLIALAPDNFRPYLMGARLAEASGETSAALEMISRARALAAGNLEAEKLVEEFRAKLRR